MYGTNGNAGTLAHHAGDVGLVPRPMGPLRHEPGTTTLRLLGCSGAIAWRNHGLQIVGAHLSRARPPQVHLDESVLARIPVRETLIVPV